MKKLCTGIETFKLLINLSYARIHVHIQCVMDAKNNVAVLYFPALSLRLVGLPFNLKLEAGR